MTRRAQMNLPALAVALLVLTTAATMSLGMADRAFLGAERDADSRRVAVALSERLVDQSGPVAVRPNVLNATELDRLDGPRLRSLFPVVADHDVRVTVGDDAVAERGDPEGVTVRRVVLVERRRAVTLTPRLAATSPAFTLPRRTRTVDLAVRPPEGTTVTEVRADGRVVLRNASGLTGDFSVRVSRFETVRFAFDADGPLPTGSVTVTYYPAETHKTVLAVTVDA
ncbi:DUF7263 family protein [Halomicrococcus sp. SG-WS-1]|uniref:DUF7263 family protein n=1 Tax=Halomicrococcus sp. SG-WS-1 TaxID=3439057 RepID=UPI003F7A85F0